jgi:hypothetical protein
MGGNSFACMSMTSRAQFSAASGFADAACLLEMLGVTDADTATIVNQPG